MSARLRNLLLGAAALLCLALAGVIVADLVRAPPLESVPIGGPFELRASDGRTLTERDFRGRYMLVYFGYTFCPDVCPTELAELSAALDAFAERSPAHAALVTPVFVSVDPERDTPAVLEAYRAHFHPRLVALTGGLDALKAMARAYKVYFAKVAPEKGADPADYLVDHSSYIFLMGPDGRYVEHFTATMAAPRIAARLDALVAE